MPGFRSPLFTDFQGRNRCHKVATLEAAGAGSGSGALGYDKWKQWSPITEHGLPKALELLEAENDPSLTGLRVAVEGGGCSGFQYALGFDGQPEEGDRVEVVHGLG